MLWARVVAYVILEKSIEFEIYSHILYYLNLNKDYINHVINIVTETLFCIIITFLRTEDLAFNGGRITSRVKPLCLCKTLWKHAYSNI